MTTRSLTSDAGLSSRASRDRRAASRLQTRLARAADLTLRAGLIGLLLYYGAFKFTEVEARAIEPLVQHSPLLGWLYDVASVRAVSSLIGIVEITLALLVAARPVAPLLSALGGLGSALTFLVTLSFLISTPGLWLRVPGFPLPVANELGSFILKDVLLLGAALYVAAEALSARRAQALAPDAGARP